MTAKLSIIFQTDPLKGLDFALNKPRVSIGRDPNNDIVIDHIEVSRKHALIEVQDGQVTITDVGSLNGTFIDGVQISGATTVLPGQVIEVSEAIRFILAEQESKAEATIVMEAEKAPSTPKTSDSLDSVTPDDRGLDDFEPFFADETPEVSEPDPDAVVREYRQKRSTDKKTFWIVIAILFALIILSVLAFVWYIDYYSLWCDVLPYLFEPGLCP